MSEQPNPKDYYADTAYTPAKRIAWEETNSDRQQISGSRLTWYRRTQDNGTKDEYGYNNIAISNNLENKCSELGVKGKDIFEAMRVHYDNKKSFLLATVRCLKFYLLLWPLVKALFICSYLHFFFLS
ncbi:hypothetical protein HORIV_48870 [Vreelandella olivaria]|uniref:Uncharacterized protein n=1 Tax=Vreelandella olivaria TaxID=390919 RepID=A0ABM7GP12_9GAMM|nr:hypothetical protein HORIV_48870 [Halomonas olivaria]